jgi:acyl-CoA synthetase (AMP-forming)/AMP-acid ligase II
MAARTFADRPAVIAGDLRLDYRTFADRVMRLATGLGALGCGVGSRVVVLSQNSLPVLELHYAIAVIGGTTVALNTRFAGAELSRCLENSAPDLVMVTGELADRLPKDGPPVFVIDAPGDGGRSTRYEELIEGSAPREGVQRASDTVAALFYTSGSTGAPKGVQLTHESVLAGALSCALAVGLDARSRWLHASPMFHLADAWAIWAATMVGACHVIERFEPRATLETIRTEGITHTILVPTALDMLADAADGDATAFDSLGAMLYGGAPIAETTYRRLVALGVPMFHTYGSTETSGCMAALRPEEHIRADGTLRLGVVGRAVPMTSIVIVDPDGREVALGQVGEITIVSPNLMIGYNQAPEQTADVLKNGRYHTGDLGRVDADGFVELSGRRKEMLISGGENVYPNEVELALREHPSVRDVGVGGLPDVRWGQRIAAVIVPTSGASLELDECQSFLAGQLAGYKIPRAVFAVDELPRNASGKIDRAALNTLLSDLEQQNAERTVGSPA